jgi:DNA-binding NarL/FixJ family response regulator
MSHEHLTRRVYVDQIALSDLDDMGMQLPADENILDENVAKISRDEVLKRLTPKQREVAILLEQGYKRKEIAKLRNTCLMAVHRIVLRMRKNLKGGGGAASQS